MPDLIGEPTWSDQGRGRVLVEATEWSHRETISAVLRRAGFDPVVCPGPQGADERCSLAAGHGCTAAEDADIIVHTLGSSDLRNREVLQSLRRRASDTPVIVEVPAPVVLRRPDEYQGCIVVDAPMSPEALIEALEGIVRA